LCFFGIQIVVFFGFFWVFFAKIYGEIPNKVKNEPQIG
jgi:hypothetical protein